MFKKLILAVAVLGLSVVSVRAEDAVLANKTVAVPQTKKAAGKSALEKAREMPTTVSFKAPSPELVEPSGDTVDIGAQQEKVKFSWKSGKTPNGIYAFLFRIYQGPETAEKKIQVANEQVSGLNTAVEIPAKVFKDGETYTVSLKQVDNMVGQLMFSDPVTKVFKVSKASDNNPQK